MIEPEQRIVSFKVVLDALLNESKLFPPAYLHSFSDLPPREAIALKKIWPEIPTKRRQSLMEDLEELADADTLVSFEDLAENRS